MVKAIGICHQFLERIEPIQELSLYLPIIKDIIVCICIVIATIFISRGFAVWRNQILGKSTKESAYKLRISIIELREDFIKARKYSPSLQYIADSFSLPDSENKNHYIFSKISSDYLIEVFNEHEARYESLKSSLINFNTLTNEAEAFFGSEIFHYKTIVNTECQNLITNFQKFRNFVYQYEEMSMHQIGSIKDLIRTIIDLPDNNIEYLKFNKDTRQFVSLANQMVEALNL